MERGNVSCELVIHSNEKKGEIKQEEKRQRVEEECERMDLRKLVAFFAIEKSNDLRTRKEDFLPMASGEGRNL
jgi:hypothetical protein